MNKTININVGGCSFIIEEDAYKVLDEYLDKIKACYSCNRNGLEIVSDIEARVGELLNEIKKGNETINLPMVECVKQRIGNPDELRAEEEEVTDDGGQKNRGEALKIKKRLYRDLREKHIAGVCSGLAAYFNIDAVWLRIGFCILFFGGLFTDWKWVFKDGQFGLIILLAYCILWICIPAAKTVRQRCEMHGEPLSLDEYKGYIPANETTVKRKRTTLANILCDILGVLLMLCGISLAMSGISLPFGQGVFAENSYNININGITEPWMTYIENGLVMLDGHTFWWLAGAHTLILGLALAYAGVKLTLGLKGPEWHPGLVLFLLWAASFIALAIYLSVNIFFGGIVLN